MPHLSVGEVFRALNLLLIFGCYIGFTPAIVHARDGVDRMYLLGGVIILGGIAYGTVVRLHAPFSPSTPIVMVGELAWAVSALMSRARRRRRIEGAERE